MDGLPVVTVVNIRHDWANVPVFRPTEYGNPFRGNRDDAVNKFAELWYSESYRCLREKALQEIRDGVVLGCYCTPKRCHADIIAGYLNWKRANL